MTNPLRVIVGGHTGLGKRQVLQRTCDYFTSQIPGARIRHYSVEDHFRVGTFVDASPERQASTYLKALEKSLQEIRDEAADIAFLSMHFSFYTAGQFISPFSLDLRNDLNETYLISLLRDAFAPDYCITLIDDIAATKARISRNDYEIQAQELLAWRDIESMIGDMVATIAIKKEKRATDIPSRKFERSLIISARHPVSFLYKYLVHPEVPRLYLSFRITGTRTKEAAVAEINHFRELVARKYTVLDPLCIDDMPLLLMAQEAKNANPLVGSENNERLPFPSKIRWFIDGHHTMIGENTDIQVSFSRQELEYVLWHSAIGAKTRIESQIEKRDYRMIDQCDFAVFYRPQYGKFSIEDRDFSGGTRAEWLYAKDTLKPRFFLHDPKFDGDVLAEAFKPGLENIPERNKIIMSPLSDPVIQDAAIAKLFDAVSRTTLA
jgi:hypothetical protein